jgi:hypothetical protein
MTRLRPVPRIALPLILGGMLVLMLATAGRYMELAGLIAFATGTLLPLRHLSYLTLGTALAVPQSHELDQLLMLWHEVHLHEVLLALLLLRVGAAMLLVPPGDRPMLSTSSRTALWLLLAAGFVVAGVWQNGAIAVLQDARPLLAYASAGAAFLLARQDPQGYVRGLAATLLIAMLLVTVCGLALLWSASLLPDGVIATLQDEGRLGIRNGSVALFSAALAAALLVFGRSSSEKLLPAVALLAVAVQLLVAQNRSMILVIPVVLVLAYRSASRMSPGRRTSSLVVIAVVLGLAMLLSLAIPGLSEGLSERFMALLPDQTLEDPSAIARLSMAAEALRQFQANMAFGSGIGSRLAIMFYDAQLAESYYIDNLWLVILVKGGIAAMLWFLAGIYGVFRSIAQARAQWRGDPILAPFVAAAAAILPGVLALAFFNAGLWAHPPMIVATAFLLGTLAAMARSRAAHTGRSEALARDALPAA